MRRAIETGCVAAILMCGVAVSLSARDARSAPATPKGGKGEPGEVVTLSASSLAALKSDDPAVVRTGLDDVRLAGTKGAAAVPQIVELLHTGLPYPLAEAAINALADIESPEAQAFVPYVSHRDPKVRRAAVRALSKATAPASVPLAVSQLERALSDPDSNVRATAALGLGALRARASVPDLFLALDHHVYEAAASIGQLCGALMGRLGKVPFDVLTTGVDQILFRPVAEVSDDVKVSIIEKVRDVGTGDANKFLRGVQGRWPKHGSVRVKREIDAAVLATLASPGAGS
jgi:HEAT repeat protein